MSVKLANARGRRGYWSKCMNIRRETLSIAAIVIVAGLAIGAWLGVLARGPRDVTRSVTIVRQDQPAARETAPAASPTPRPAPPPPAPARALPTATPLPTAAPPSSPAHETLRGSWQLDEANVRVGTIVWAGDAVPNGNTLVFDAHKQSVGGRAAVPCERQTRLHATFSIGVVGQSVPYRETNCDGVVSTGEVRVQSFSPNSDAFSGSFWQDGVMLGQFAARRR